MNKHELLITVKSNFDEDYEESVILEFAYDIGEILERGEEAVTQEVWDAAWGSIWDAVEEWCPANEDWYIDAVVGSDGKKLL